MSQEEQIKELAMHFKALGAREPEDWARSQVIEGIPQYARYVFLRQAWKEINTDGDTSWIEPSIEAARRNPRGPGAGIGPALERVLAAGVSREDIAEIVRVMQWSVLSRLAYQLSDPGVVDYPRDDMPKVGWGLFAIDKAGKPLHEIDGLHESVLDTDPSGREMRPKGVTREG